MTKKGEKVELNKDDLKKLIDSTKKALAEAETKLAAMEAEDRRAAVARVAELNAQINVLAKELVEVSSRWNLSVTIDIDDVAIEVEGGYVRAPGWDSSSAYC